MSLEPKAVLREWLGRIEKKNTYEDEAWGAGMFTCGQGGDRMYGGTEHTPHLQV